MDKLIENALLMEEFKEFLASRKTQQDQRFEVSPKKQKTLDSWLIKTNKPTKKRQEIKIPDVTCVVGDSNSTKNSSVNKNIIAASSTQFSNEISVEETNPIISTNDGTAVASSSNSRVSNETLLKNNLQPVVLCEKLDLHVINSESLSKSGLSGIDLESKLSSVIGNSPSKQTEVKKSKIAEQNLESRQYNDIKSKNENILKEKTDIRNSSESDYDVIDNSEYTAPNMLGRKLRPRKKSNEILADSVSEKTSSLVNNNSKPQACKMSKSIEGKEPHSTLEKINTKTRSNKEKWKLKAYSDIELISENHEINVSSEIFSTTEISKEQNLKKSQKTSHFDSAINTSEKEHVENTNILTPNKSSPDVKSKINLTRKSSSPDSKQIGKIKKTGLSTVLAKPNMHLKRNLIKMFDMTDKNNDSYSEVKNNDINEKQEQLEYKDKPKLKKKQTKPKILQKPFELVTKNEMQLDKGNISVVLNNENQKEKNIDKKLEYPAKVCSKTVTKKTKNISKAKKSSSVIKDKNIPNSSNLNQYDNLSQKENLNDEKSESVNQNAFETTADTTFEVAKNVSSSASAEQVNQLEKISSSSTFEIEMSCEPANMDVPEAENQLVSNNDTAMLSMPLINIENDERIQLNIETRQKKRRIEQCESSSADEGSSNIEIAVPQNKRKYFNNDETFKDYCKFNELLSSHGLVLDNIFRTPTFRSMVEKYRNNQDAIVFIGTVKCPLTGRVEPNVRMHKSKKRLLELLSAIQAKKDEK